MKRLFAIILLMIIMTCSLYSCSSEGSKDYEEITNRLQGIRDRQDLYYDVNTRIVYIIFNECYGYSGYGYMSPYYADNGLPYQYNPMTNELTKINND